MQAAAGSNVVTADVTAKSGNRRDSLTPQTDVDGVLQPAKEVLAVYELRRAFISNPIAWKLILLVFIQVILVTMVYGPIAAYLVEAFPAKIRYTALSLPYHIGNGVFGGLLPLIGSRWWLENRKHLRGLVLSDDRRGPDVYRGIGIAEGNQARADMG